MQSSLSCMLLIKLFALALTTSYLSFVQTAGSPEGDLQALCANKIIDLTQSSQLKLLVEQLSNPASNSFDCSDELKAALVELNELIDANEYGCSMKHIDRFKGFYLKYLDESATGREQKQAANLPKSFERFVLAYGMQVSNACRRNMVWRLMVDANRVLKDKDFKEVDGLVNAKGSLSRLLGDSDPDNMLLPTDLAAVTNSNYESGLPKGEKICVQVKTGAVAARLQAVCSRRFKPFYEPIIMPLVKLSKLGFRYTNAELRAQLKSSEVVELVGRWSRIVFMCEALGGVELVQMRDANNDDDLKQGDTTGVKVIRVLTKTETDEAVESGHGKLLFEAGNEMFAKDVEQIHFKPKLTTYVGGDILEVSDKKLLSAISSFRKNVSELENTKRQLGGRIWKILKGELKQGRFYVIASVAFKRLIQSMKQTTKKPDPANNVDTSTELVRIIDQVVDTEQNPDGAVSNIGWSSETGLFYWFDFSPHSGDPCVDLWVIIILLILYLIIHGLIVWLG